MCVDWLPVSSEPGKSEEILKEILSGHPSQIGVSWHRILKIPPEILVDGTGVRSQRRVESKSFKIP